MKYIFRPTKGFWIGRLFNIIEEIESLRNHGIVNDWFTTYLVERRQITQTYLQNLSNKETVLSWVLGPLLFLLYTNDITNSCDRLQFHLFSDDTNLLFAHQIVKTLESIVNDELSNVYNWLIANKLFFNITKLRHYVIFRPRQNIK